MGKYIVNAMPDTPGLQKNEPPVTDGTNSGGAVTKGLGDDTFGVRSGGGGAGGDSPARGVVDTPMKYSEPGK